MVESHAHMLTSQSGIMVQPQLLYLMAMKKWHDIHPVVSFIADTKFSGKKEVFPLRDVKKQKLIRIVSDELTKRSCTVINTTDDADVDIVKVAVGASLRLEKIQISLSYFFTMHNKTIRVCTSDQTGRELQVYDINHVEQIFGHEECSQLLFVHAMTGCNTSI